VIVNGKAEVAPGFTAKLAEASPVQDAYNYVAQPLRLRGILLYHGLYDDLVPAEIVRGFDALLNELGVEHDYREVDAGHCGMDKEPILQFMSERLVFEEP
jgi:predicted esterase